MIKGWDEVEVGIFKRKWHAIDHVGQKDNQPTLKLLYI